MKRVVHYKKTEYMPFIMAIETTSTVNEFTIPTAGGGYNYNVEIAEINIGQSIDIHRFNNVTGSLTITNLKYDTTYYVLITGAFPRIYFRGSTSTNRNLVKHIQRFGDIKWQSMYGAFFGCTNLTYVDPSDSPDLSECTTIQEMFYGCINLTGSIGNWDVSTITDMYRTFYNCRKMNWDISNWDTSNVVNMSQMFYDCHVFNRSLASWDTSSVTNMLGMFVRCYVFNQSLSGWNVSNVTNFSQMFYSCHEFNGSLLSWDTSSATIANRMFYDARKFNQAVNHFNVSNVSDMTYMFYNCQLFNQPVNNWNTSNVTNMLGMFLNCYKFNQVLNSWNISNVTNMSSMLRNCTDYTQNIYFSNSTTGSISVGNLVSFCTGVKSDNIYLRCTSLPTISSNSFDTTSSNARLYLYGLKDIYGLTVVNLYINNISMSGTNIDFLANSCGQSSGNATVRMTLAQRNSCNQSLWTNKNWTIATI